MADGSYFTYQNQEPVKLVFPIAKLQVLDKTWLWFLAQARG